jgi:hypothetical protein
MIGGELGTPFGIPFRTSRHMPRGSAVLIGTRLDGEPDVRLILFGSGLLRGVPYSVPLVVERGYVLREHADGTATLVDAVTGRLVRVIAAEAVEVARD